MALDENIDLVVEAQDPAGLITSGTLEQVLGVGNGAATYQAACDFEISELVAGGGFFHRFKSDFDALTHTKSGLFDLGPEGWPQRIPKSAIFGNNYTMSSRPNLSVGPIYNCLGFWVGPDYYEDLDAATTGAAANAIVAAADAAGQLWPAGDAVFVSTAGVMSATTSPATSISAPFSVVSGAAAGTIIGIATADRSNGTFSVGTPNLSWITVAANGTMSIATGEQAPALGMYNIELRYDNSAIPGGDVFTKIVTITVTDQVVGQTPGFVAAPTQNAARFTTVAQLEAALVALESNWSLTMASTYGLPTSGTEPVFTLAAGFHGDLGTWSYDFSAHEHVHIRGEGPFTRNDYRPIGGTKLGTVRWSGCQKLHFWLMDMKPASVLTGNANRNANNHWMRGCQNCSWNRNLIGGDIAESEADMAVRIKDGTYFLVDIRNTTDCQFVNNVCMGARSGFFGSAGNDPIAASNILWQGNVFDQLSDDFFQLYGDHAIKNCISRNNVGVGRTRNPGNKHTDYFQNATAGGTVPDASGWLHEGLWFQQCGYDGNDGSIATKGFHNQGKQTSVALNATIRDCAFLICGNGISGGKYGTGTSVTFCTFLPPIDVSGNEDNEPAPADGSYDVTWTAAVSGFAGQPNFFKDHNVIVTNNGSAFVAVNVGPNGLMIDEPGCVATNYGVPGLGAGPGGQVSGKNNPSGNYNWANAYGPRLANFKHPDIMTNTRSREISAWTTAVPRRDGGIEQWKPIATSDIGWKYSGTKRGSYRLFERMFDDLNHDHPKDHGWPTAAQFHNRYDRTNAAGGAFGTYTTFDNDGNYLG